MISDTIYDAIQEIEDYQRTQPEVYDAHREHITVVKAVMGSLLEVLDEPPFNFGIWYERLVNTHLTEDQREHWRVWCEAGLARWAERLRLLGPLTEDDLLERIRCATERQDAMLNRCENEGPERSRHDFLTCLCVWCLLDDITPVGQRLDSILASLSTDGEAMPVDACNWLGLQVGSTYSDGSRAVSAALS